MVSRRIELEKLNNTRDLGGMKTASGKTVRSGKLIRSGALFGAGEEDKTFLTGNVDVIVDFRTDQEVFEKPDPYLAGLQYHHIPVLTSWTAGLTWEIKTDLSEEELFAKLQKEPDLAMKYMQGIYRGFASNLFYISQYQKFIRILLKEQEKAILWHCTAGKDRAGFASVIVEELLGIDRQTIIEDYLQTGQYLKEETARLTAHLRTIYTEPGAVSDEAMRYLFGAEPEFIEAVYDNIDELYGSFETFIKDALKVSEEERAFLQKIYLED